MTKADVLARLEEIRATAIPAKLLNPAQNDAVLKLYRATAAFYSDAGETDAARRAVLQEAIDRARGVIPPAVLGLPNGSAALLYDLALKMVRV